jgi:elongation factor P--(R)-beta-lysine ligase
MVLAMNDTWQATASSKALQQRAEIYRHLRQFFHARNVLEVETPMLSEAGNTDPNIESFHVQFSGSMQAGNATRWLRTSPEFALKRLLASGIGDCYELGRVFRNGEFGRKHNPEFSMLEWYRVGWDHLQLIEECIELVQQVFALKDIALHVQRLTYQELFIGTIGIDPHAASDKQLCTALQSITEINSQGLRRDDLLDLLLTHCIEPTFSAQQLTVIYDFPASQCALAKIRFDEIPVAERFELYLGSVELANGYHELTDAKEQNLRFDKDIEVRKMCGSAYPDKDQRLIDALPFMPACAGVAMGIDRLMMSLLMSECVNDVIAFDFSRA